MMAIANFYTLIFFVSQITKSDHISNHRRSLQFESCIETIGNGEIIIPTHNLTKDWTYPGNGTNNFMEGCAGPSYWAGSQQPKVPTMRSGDNLENCSAISQYCFTNTETNIIDSIEFKFQYSWGYENLDSSNIYSYFILAMVSNDDLAHPSQLWSWTSPAYNDPLYSWDDCNGQRGCYSPIQTHNWNVNLDVSHAIAAHFAINFINLQKNLHILPETLVIKIKWKTSAPTRIPTESPTQFPTKTPTKTPTQFPIQFPTKTPEKIPTTAPTKHPSKFPTKYPVNIPSIQPTVSPNQNPILMVDSGDGTSMTTTKIQELITTISLNEKGGENMNDDALFWILVMVAILTLLFIIIMLLLLIWKRYSCMLNEVTDMKLEDNGIIVDVSQYDECDNNIDVPRQKANEMQRNTIVSNDSLDDMYEPAENNAKSDISDDSSMHNMPVTVEGPADV